MKLQTARTSDKAVHTKVSVKEKVSREMSISAQREEKVSIGKEKTLVRHGDREKQEEERLNPSKKDHTIKI